MYEILERRSFYEHIGFRIVDSDEETGNITMQLSL